MALIPQYLVESFIKLNTLMAEVPNIEEARVMAFVETIDVNLWKNASYLVALELGITAFFSPLAVGAATYVTKQVLHGKAINRSEMLDASVGKIGKYLFTAVVLYSILITSVIFVIPFIFFYIVFYFSQNAVADEGKWGISAFRKSYSIVKGRWFKTLLFVLAIFILKTIVSYFFSTGGSIFVVIFFSVMNELFSLWFVVAVCVKYFNLSALQHARSNEKTA